MPLFGLSVAPILVTQLLKVVGWQWIFAIASLPGLLVAFLLYRVLRNGGVALHAQPPAPPQEAPAQRWSDVLRYRNIPLNMLGLLCSMQEQHGVPRD